MTNANQCKLFLDNYSIQFIITLDDIIEIVISSKRRKMNGPVKFDDHTKLTAIQIKLLAM